MGQNNAIRLTRFENWPLLLSRYIQERDNLPFVWGENDCLLFCAGCVNALTGVDFGAEFRAKNYTNEAQAKELIAKYGTMTDLVSFYLGNPRPFPMKNRRGDIVIADIEGVSAAGVIDDTGRNVAFLTHKGIIRLPVKETMMVWGYG